MPPDTSPSELRGVYTDELEGFEAFYIAHKHRQEGRVIAKAKKKPKAPKKAEVGGNWQPTDKQQQRQRAKASGSGSGTGGKPKAKAPPMAVPAMDIDDLI